VDLFRLRYPVCKYPLKYEFNKNYGLNLYLCTNEPEVCDFMTKQTRQFSSYRNFHASPHWKTNPNPPIINHERNTAHRGIREEST